MWPCYGVHIIASMALLVCVLCQPVHSCTEPALHGLGLEIFYRLYNTSSQKYIFDYHPHVLAIVDLLMLVTQTGLLIFCCFNCQQAIDVINGYCIVAQSRIAALIKPVLYK